MTPWDVVRDGWLIVGLVALAYTIQKVIDAWADLAAQRATNEDGAVLYQVRWSFRTTVLSVAIASMKALAPLAAIVGVLHPTQPNIFGLIALIALFLDTLLFTVKQRDDVQSRSKLTQIIRIERALTSEPQE